MTPITSLRPEFVEFIPDALQPGVLYVSVRFATAAHRCCCGCGREVVTPLTPTDWALTFDGETVSLHPSIGNWSFPCQSHYWIARNGVRWARRWTPEEIRAGREFDAAAKAERYAAPEPPALPPPGRPPAPGLWARIRRWFG